MSYNAHAPVAQRKHFYATADGEFSLQTNKTLVKRIVFILVMPLVAVPYTLYAVQSNLHDYKLMSME